MGDMQNNLILGMSRTCRGLIRMYQKAFTILIESRNYPSASPEWQEGALWQYLSDSIRIEGAAVINAGGISHIYSSDPYAKNQFSESMQGIISI